MPVSDILIKGAREHNLRSIDLRLPRNRLICLTGVSGSGKSSLAFDTLYAEGQRRYIESLSTFARQFLGQMPKPDVDYISGLSPSISISQKSAGQNPRSTVGTITEIYDYLRVLFARVGQGHCPQCGRAITAQSRDQILERILTLPAGTRFLVLAPLIRAQKGEHRDLFADLLKRGYLRARVDGRVVNLSDNLKLDRQMRHYIEVVVDRLVAGPEIRARLAEAVEAAQQLGQGDLIISSEAGEVFSPSLAPAEARVMPDDASDEEGPNEEALAAGAEPASSRTRDVRLSARYACTHCNLSFEPPSPQLFSFNSPQGMCTHCDGLGEVYGFDPERLIPDSNKSFKEGCFELIEPWRQLGRWRKHLYEGVADTLEFTHKLPAGTLLETPWNKLEDRWRQALLWGTGDLHITYTWRHGAGVHKYGGTFAGILPELISTYRNAKSGMKRRQLEKYMSVVPCGVCAGERLNPQARAVRITTAHERFAARSSQTLSEVCHLSIADAACFFSGLVLDPTGHLIAGELLKEIRARLGFLLNVGLEYLTIDRSAPTLSGGEAQRIRLASQIGSGLVGVLYILDEPSIGLHPRDNDRLLGTLTRLRDMGNTVIVVEHDEETMRAADYVVDFGPGPGVRGGQVVAAGPPEAICAEANSLTGQFLSGARRIEVPAMRRQPGSARLKIVGAQHHNLRGVDVEFPLGMLICVTGVSGSGKSSLVNDILSEALHRDLNAGQGDPGRHERIEGIEHLDKLIAIDQSPIGRTPRSNPATYIKVFDEIRDLYTQLTESRARGYKPGRFSFNVSGGRCEACEGNGSNRLEMDFLADIWVTCPVCEGRRFNRETLQVQFKGKSIAEVLEMDIQQALEHFENVPRIRHMLATLHAVGLDYLKLGQPSPTLSGGEAQRIKLARELVKRSTGRTLYLLDEPTTGLHFADIDLLLRVLHGFVDQGNTVLVVEHNLDVIKTADWVIDLGPEGGDGGGCIVAAGTPEEVARAPHSYTGQALAGVLDLTRSRSAAPAARTAKAASEEDISELSRAIRVQGARQHNLKSIDVEIPRDRMTVCCGLSGSGKSSLAMDTVYAEGQRRYVESLSAYARQFVAQMQKPQVDHISGLSPAIAIEQKNLGHTPRSTVGTVTEIYDYLRILFARLGTLFCPQCEVRIGTQTADEIIDKIVGLPSGSKIYLLAPLEIHVGEKYEALWQEIRAKGYVRMRIDGQTYSVEEPPQIDRRRKHDVEVVVDRITVRADARSRIADSVESALSLGKGVLRVAHVDTKQPEPRWQVDTHSQHYACDRCGRSFEPLTPHSFSFNSSLGWCSICEGLGVQLGANLSALVRDLQRTLAQGAVALWPGVNQPLFGLMLAALSQQTGLPTDVPFDQLSARHRRLVLHGSGEQWIDVPRPGTRDRSGPPWFRYQYKGLYPALEEASRVSSSLRGRLEHLVGEVECAACGGSRLRDDASAVRFRDRTLHDLCRMPLGDLVPLLDGWKLTVTERKIAGELFREVRNRLSFLLDVGLEYLTLARGAPTLSGGEAQRIRLASQVGSGLTGVLYVLDEPTVGLHPRDNRRLIGALTKLRDLGNTLLLVEHDREVIEQADQLLDFGPGAGEHGGQIVARGVPAAVAGQPNSVTGGYLSGEKAIGVPTNRRLSPLGPSGKGRVAKKTGATRGDAGKRVATAAKEILTVDALEDPPGGGWLEVVGVRHNNLKHVRARFPLGALSVVTGVSGSGKSSLIEDVLFQAVSRMVHHTRSIPAPHDALLGVEQINKVIRVDQQPLGNTPTSNPATYTGAFELIRQLYAQLPDAKMRGYTARRFSFNVPGGRCETCEGNGQKRVEMHFLPDVWVECDVCRGQRYNQETLAVRFHGHSIADVLDMPCGRAVKLFRNIPKIRRILETLCDVGLDYVRLGQSAPTLSGGEAQRVKLAAELARPDTGRTLYLLDEPTTGLHFEDLAKLLDVLNRLVDLGNTVVVIEHNLDVIKTADWVIDLGPEAGEQGGYVVAEGTPEMVADIARRWQQAQGTTSQSARRTRTSRALVAAGAAPASGLSRRTRGALAGSANAASVASAAPQWRSYTGEMLAAVLAAGPHIERKPFDFAAHEANQADDLDITEVGRETRMPWEIDGRRWHTQDRVGRSGEICHWDGKILAHVVDRIHELGSFSATDWNGRTVVEISAEKKSDGWFFHAMTGHPWLLTLKFRVPRSTFQREALVESLNLRPLNELRDLPVYGTEPRVKCKNLRGPWQEIQLQVYQRSEIARPEFEKFLEQAVAGFHKLTQRRVQDPDAITPWKVLGKKWHLARRGFPPGRKVDWTPETLEKLIDLLSQVAPAGEFHWNQQQVVHLRLPGTREPWAVLYTKRRASLDLVLSGPKGRVALGRFAQLGWQRELHTDDDRDLVKLQFRSSAEVSAAALGTFLREHLQVVQSG